MTHEKFKVFNQTNASYAEVEQFLNTGDIIPRSISLASGYAIIGYEEDPDKTISHRYKVVTRIVPIVEVESAHRGYGELPAFLGISTPKDIDASGIEAEANTLEGVICQDVVSYNGNFIITFLTIKRSEEIKEFKVPDTRRKIENK